MTNHRSVVASVLPPVLLWVLAATTVLAGPRVCKSEGAAESSTSATGEPVLLAFHAQWCGPCQSMRPPLDELCREGYTVRHVDIDREKELAVRYHIESVPCFVVVQQGQEIDRVTGVTTTERLKLKLKAKGGWRKEETFRPAAPVPHPAWRYERPDRHRAAVVRIYCQDGTRTRSIGSGTLVKWGPSVVVLTARHVVKDAKTIVVELSTKQTHRAKVLAIDPVWDCAVLELDGEPANVEPAEVERGRAAMQSAGNRLESCGYGGDGKLACNSGLFLGYKRSSETPDGPDDWFAISGHARPGDSGGGVFNQQGKLVGVLWGTDGQEVVCVQAGRLHRLLDTALVASEDVAQQKSILPRAPTPAMSADSPPAKPAPYEPTVRGDCPNFRLSENGTVPLGTPARPALPWRRDQISREEAQQAEIEALIRLEGQRSAAESRAAATGPTQSSPAKEGDSTAAKKENAASPLGAGLVVLGSLAIGGAFYSLTKKKN